MDLQARLEELKSSTQAKLARMCGNNAGELQELRVQVFGKKGSLTELLKGLKDPSKEMRPVVGKQVNEVRDVLTKAFEEQAKIIEAAEIQAQLESESLDVTLLGRQVNLGNRHVLTQTSEEIEDIFLGVGFQAVGSYKVGSDYYNFERMNLPKDHSMRDMQDMFYITEEILLRTHTSPVQTRTLNKHDFSRGPLKMISPGYIFRHGTDDAAHSHQFHQIEGPVIGESTSMGDLKETLKMIIKKMFDEDREIRLRPSYFPFTESSVEVDVPCFKCGGKGCNVCKKTGWIEVLDVGMVHPRVLGMSSIDSEKHSGFAFGLSQGHIVMLHYGINDIRGFYQGDVRFSEQFK